MSYSGMVTKIKLRPHPNADKLAIAQCGPYQVVVAKDTPDLSLGVFFAVDGQLSEEFAKQHDLISRKEIQQDPNDPSKTIEVKKGGYFSENRKVRCQKLRGEKSEGFWMPISCLEYTGVDLSSLKDGDEITSVNGKLICQKYFTPATLKAIGNRNTKPVKQNKYFAKHFETGHFKREAKCIPTGAVLYVTAKLHGTCTIAKTPVKMFDGSIKKIKDVKIGDEVIGMNNNGEICKAIVTDVINNGSNKDNGWLKISVSRSGLGHGNSYSSVVVTKDHLIYNPITKEWVEAKNLNIGDDVLVIKTNLKPSKSQKSMLLGKLLGDGYLVRRKCSAKVYYGHKKEHEEYIDVIQNLLGKLNNPYRQYKTSGFGSAMVTCNTKDSSWIYEMFSDMYDNAGKRTIPDWVVNELNDISVAFWYMDDGSLQHHSSQEDRATFATCAYDKVSVEKLSLALNNLGYANSIKLFDNGNGKSYWRIYVKTEASDKMFKNISKYIVPCMRYKLPEKYRNENFNMTMTMEDASDEPISINTKIVSIEESMAFYGYNTKWDLTTTTHNYFGNEILIHNSHRFGYVKDTVEIPLNFVKRMLNKIYPFFQTTTEEYKYYNGSRNVVLEKNNGADGYYGNDGFRFKITDPLKGLLNKGEVIYGEIVGFTSGGSPIMGSLPVKDKEQQKVFGKSMTFSYGMESPNCDFYVYRITNVNEDGIAVDLSHQQMAKRCEQLGLKTVPLMLPPFVYDGDVDKLKEKLDVLLEKPSIVDPRHVEEGVCVRWDEYPNCRILKHKSFTFLGLEDEQKSKDDYVDQEEAA